MPALMRVSYQEKVPEKGDVFEGDEIRITYIPWVLLEIKQHGETKAVIGPSRKITLADVNLSNVSCRVTRYTGVDFETIYTGQKIVVKVIEVYHSFIKGYEYVLEVKVV